MNLLPYAHEEHDIVVDLCIKQAAGRVPIIAGLDQIALQRLFASPNTLPKRMQMRY